MEKRTHKKWEYYWRAIKWLAGNLIFGLFPLLFMCSIYWLSDEKVGGAVIDDQIYEGAIHFVCLALVGSVVLDVYLSGIHFKGLFRFMVYAWPITIVGFVSLTYLLIKLNLADKSRFAMGSYTSWVVFVMSVFYIIFVKSSLSMKEDLNYVSTDL